MDPPGHLQNRSKACPLTLPSESIVLDYNKKFPVSVSIARFQQAEIVEDHYTITIIQGVLELLVVSLSA